MLTYEDQQTWDLLDTVGAMLARQRDEVLEDLGTYLVSHPNSESVRRLLRFGGDRFGEFLITLDDLPERVRLAVADLNFPYLELDEDGPDCYRLVVIAPQPGWGHVLVGVLRAMADDYGDLVILDHAGRDGAAETIRITVIEQAFSEGRSFDLAANTG